MTSQHFLVNRNTNSWFKENEVHNLMSRKLQHLAWIRELTLCLMQVKSLDNWWNVATGKSKDVSDTEKITVFQHFSPSSLSQAWAVSPLARFISESCSKWRNQFNQTEPAHILTTLATLRGLVFSFGNVNRGTRFICIRCGDIWTGKDA